MRKEKNPLWLKWLTIKPALHHASCESSGLPKQPGNGSVSLFSSINFSLRFITFDYNSHFDSLNSHSDAFVLNPNSSDSFRSCRTHVTSTFPLQDIHHLFLLLWNQNLSRIVFQVFDSLDWRQRVVGISPGTMTVWRFISECFGIHTVDELPLRLRILLMNSKWIYSIICIHLS